MLNVNIITVGKIKDDYIKQGCNEFIKRLKPLCNLQIIELNEQKLNNKETDYINCLNKEGKEILNKAKGYLIGLCIEGNIISSKELADKFNELALGGNSTISFIIGSSYGLSDEVKIALNYKLSISKMTFTHTLARLILLEQIYRGFTINENIKYHK